MVHDQVDIPLCQELKRSLFGQYHTEHRMYIFHTGLLTAAHGITVIDTRPDNAIDTDFQRIRIPEFCSAVCLILNSGLDRLCRRKNYPEVFNYCMNSLQFKKILRHSYLYLKHQLSGGASR